MIKQSLINFFLIYTHTHLYLHLLLFIFISLGRDSIHQILELRPIFFLGKLKLKMKPGEKQPRSFKSPLMGYTFNV